MGVGGVGSGNKNQQTGQVGPAEHADPTQQGQGATAAPEKAADKDKFEASKGDSAEKPVDQDQAAQAAQAFKDKPEQTTKDGAGATNPPNTTNFMEVA